MFVDISAVFSKIDLNLNYILNKDIRFHKQTVIKLSKRQPKGNSIVWQFCLVHDYFNLLFSFSEPEHRQIVREH